jgi:hypothetical protein
MLVTLVLIPLAIVGVIGLLNFQRWGKTLLIVIAIVASVDLVTLPIGQGIGIWTLVLLLNGHNSATYKELCGTAK